MTTPGWREGMYLAQGFLEKGMFPGYTGNPLVQLSPP